MPDDSPEFREFKRMLQENTNATREVAGQHKALQSELRENTVATREQSRKFDIHEAEHKAIAKSLQDHSDTLYHGNQREPGLVQQANECKTFRSESDKKGANFPQWLMVIGGLAGALAAVVMIVLEIIKMTHH